MNILVTGAGGYIGSTLCGYLLECGHNVIAIDTFIYDHNYSLAQYFSNRNFHYFRLDVFENLDEIVSLAKVHNIDLIIPLAALVGASICDKYPELAEKINTKAIIYLFERHKCRFIYPNTNSGYGSIAGICTEDTPMLPISIYGQTKCETEKYLLEKGGKLATILRLATVFGPSNRMRLDLLINDWSYRIFHNENIKIFDRNFNRNYVHVNDVARGILQCVAYPAQVGGEVFNLGNDDLNCSKEELFKRIATRINGKVVTRVEYSDESDPDQRNYIVSSEKMMTKTAWKPLFSLMDGVDSLVSLFNSFPKNKEKLAAYTACMFNR